MELPSTSTSLASDTTMTLSRNRKKIRRLHFFTVVVTHILFHNNNIIIVVVVFVVLVLQIRMCVGIIYFNIQV